MSIEFYPFCPKIFKCWTNSIIYRVMEELDMNFNDRLSLIRKDNNMSRETLANKLGVSYSTIAKYESGSRQPDFDTLQSIARLFDVTTDYLLGKTDNPNLTKDDELEAIRNDPKLNLMFDNWKGMSEEERERALEFVNFLIHEREKDK